MTIETFGLSVQQQREAIDIVKWNARNPFQWEDLSPAERQKAALAWLERHRPEDVPSSKLGVSPRQLDALADAISDTLDELLPDTVAPIVKSSLRQICEEEGLELDQAEIHRIAARVGDLVPAARDFNKLQREVAALAQEVKTLNDSMLKFATAKATDDESTTPSATTSQRQLSRHAEHLANLESRLKTLERNK
jgi:hypothetical protein